jgi:secreted PhoX family phosphatase
MFVNIQHPGESTTCWNATPAGPPSPTNPSTVSNWPYGTASNPRRPRPATVVVRKIDGGRIGS